MVHAVALAHVGPKDAEDVVQEVFLKALTTAAQPHDGGNAGPWLAAIARTTAIDALRRRTRDAGLAAAASLGAGSGTASTTPDAAARIEACEVLAAIHRLPEAYREPLVLRLVEGLTGPQIAQELGMTHGSVRVNLSKGMEQLRAALGWSAPWVPGREATP